MFATCFASNLHAAEAVHLSELKAQHPQHLTVMPLDVSQPHSIKSWAADLHAAGCKHIDVSTAGPQSSCMYCDCAYLSLKCRQPAVAVYQYDIVPVR